MKSSADQIRALWEEIARIKSRLAKTSSGSINTFIGLPDTPASFSGSAGKFLNVNAGMDAVEFDDIANADLPSVLTAKSYQSNVQNAFVAEPFGSGAGETGEIRFLELTANGANYVGFKAPDALAADLVFVLPSSDGAAGEFLKTDGLKNLSWQAVGGGGDVSGPAAATDNAFARFDGTTGKLIQDSNFTLDDTGKALLVAASNANMTIGITIDQGGADDETFAIKSSDVAHGFTSYTETDTYFRVLKVNGAGGGALLDALSDADVLSTESSLKLRAVTKNPNFTGAGLPSGSVAQLQALYGSGTTRSAAPSGMNLWSVRTYDNTGTWTTVWVIKENGNALLKGNFGIGVDVPDAFIHVSDGGTEPSWSTGTSAIFQNNSSSTDKSRIAIIAGADTDSVVDFGNSTDQDRGAIYYNHADDYMGFRVAATEAMRISGTILFIGETLNAQMTQGLTINQGANDNEIFSLKSSDVAHGFTSYTETDTFFHVNKAYGAGGGALIDALSDADIDPGTPTFQIRGVTKDSGYTGSGLAAGSVVQVQGLYGSGTSRTAAPSGMNVWSVRTYDNSGAWVTLWVIKENGKAHLKGDMIVESGILTLAETTTPTALANYGKIYFKSDNNLYAQDGGGTEHQIQYV